MVLIPSPPEHLSLPQEIIDQIVDDVAGPCYEGGDATSLRTLRACSLVSKSFNIRARRHIFSQIELTVDESVQRRSRKLLKILGHHSLVDSTIRNIHTFSLLFDTPSVAEPYILRIMGLGGAFTIAQQRIARSLNRNNSLHDILKILSHAPIVHFNFGARKILSRSWDSQDRLCIMNTCLQIVTNPSLRTLRFSHQIFLPQTFIKNACYSNSLQELVLCGIIDFSPDDTEANADELRCPVPKLEKLELLCVPYTALLNILCSLTSISTFPKFSHLRTLAVTIANTRSEMESLWKIMQGVSPFLETLDVQHTGWTGKYVHLEPCLQYTKPTLSRNRYSLAKFHLSEPFYSIAASTLYRKLTNSNVKCGMFD